MSSRPAESEPSHSPKRRLLIIEPDSLIRLTLGEILGAEDRALIFAEDLATARQIASGAGPFDLALVDEVLPDGRGIDIIPELRRDQPDCEAIVLGYSTLDLAQETREVGVFDYLRKPFDDVSHVAYMVRNALDTLAMRREHQRLLIELNRHDKRCSLVAEATSDGLWDWDLVENQVDYSARFKELLGYEPGSEVKGPEAWFSRVESDDLQWLKRELSKLMAGDTGRIAVEYRVNLPGAAGRWMRCQAVSESDENGNPVRLVGAQTDITAHKEVTAQLAHDALHDALTRLPNRVLFMERLERALARMKADPKRAFSVLLLDLDRFKNVNETLGPAAGDELLVAVSRRLLRCVRMEHTLARMGGDEFAVLFEDMESSDTVSVTLKRIEQAFQNPVAIEGHRVNVTCSMGVAMGAPEYRSADELLRDADTAAYQAKGLGGARHEVFVGSMRASVERQMTLEIELWQAVEARRFDVAYQPIVKLRPVTLVGFEALVRWEHPRLGRISPVDFIPVAEQTGAIVGLGEFVLGQACEQLAEWRKRTDGELYVSVNLSPRQLMDPELTVRIMELAVRARVSPNHVRLEVTEGVLVSDMEHARLAFEDLTRMGFSLSLDDFGTGYSSLSYLHQLPFSNLKIDRAFVGNSSSDERSRSLVRAMIHMASALRLDAVAEGIETPEQLELLRELGCGYGQGFLFSRPLTTEGALALVSRVGNAGWQTPNEFEPPPRGLEHRTFSSQTLHTLALLRGLNEQPQAPESAQVAEPARTQSEVPTRRPTE